MNACSVAFWQWLIGVTAAGLVLFVLGRVDAVQRPLIVTWRAPAVAICWIMLVAAGITRRLLEHDPDVPPALAFGIPMIFPALGLTSAALFYRLRRVSISHVSTELLARVIETVVARAPHVWTELRPPDPRPWSYRLARPLLALELRMWKASPDGPALAVTFSVGHGALGFANLSIHGRGDRARVQPVIEAIVQELRRVSGGERRRWPLSFAGATIVTGVLLTIALKCNV